MLRRAGALARAAVLLVQWRLWWRRQPAPLAVQFIKEIRCVVSVGARVRVCSRCRRCARATGRERETQREHIINISVSV